MVMRIRCLVLSIVVLVAPAARAIALAQERAEPPRR
jgi:hypothetical protein